MAQNLSDTDLNAILDVVRRHPEGVSMGQIAGELPPDLPRRTLQYRVRQLVEAGRLHRSGDRRGARYRLADGATQPSEDVSDTGIALSDAAQDIRTYLQQPPHARTPVGYDRAFLDSYRPNETAYLSDTDRAQLQQLSQPGAAGQPAGTYAQQILNRLLIDLSWNSSRLEGNTYSLLDTRRLIEFGEAAQGRDQLEAQMILNHKDAIGFLVGEAGEIGFNRYTILNLHAILASNLLPDEAAAGRLRHIAVGIERSAFHPLEVPQIIEECFDQVLTTASAISDPFEQAFFTMVHLPYLQPFDDVNKRVSRLAANIPFIRSNLIPLSFADVPRGLYTEAVLGVYELNRVELLRDLFLWAYERSVARYTAVRQSLGEPDPFRLRYRDALRQTIGDTVRSALGRKDALKHVRKWAAVNITPEDQALFIETVENELLGLHEGNFARYAIRPSEFAAWQNAWTKTT